VVVVVAVDHSILLSLHQMETEPEVIHDKIRVSYDAEAIANIVVDLLEDFVYTEASKETQLASAGAGCSLAG
jgi:hypothetical protein